MSAEPAAPSRARPRAATAPDDPAEVVIEAENLTRTFGPTVGVDGLSLRVGRGEVLGLLGPNGAGKTTTVRMLAGLIAPTSGQARVAGFRLGDPRTAAALRAWVGLLPEEPGLYPDLSATATLDFYGRLYGMPRPARADRIEVLLRRLGLWERRDTPAGTYSKGMRQRLALARALVHQPPVLFLDEPTANLDPEAAAVVREVLIELRGAGHTILVNTHQLEEAQRLCDRVAILRTRLIAIGTPAQLGAPAGARTVSIELDAVTNAVLAAARAVAAGAVQASADRLHVPLADPRRDTPSLVRTVVAAGGRIQQIVQDHASLEDIYLHLVAGQPNLRQPPDGQPFGERGGAPTDAEPPTSSSSGGRA